MAPSGTHWLTTLRRKRRGVLLALLPALLLWTASGSACLAMLVGNTQASGATAQSAPAGHDDAHAEHAHASHTHIAPSPGQASPAPSHDCPHCPPHHGTDAPAHAAACVDSTDTPASQATSSNVTFAAWLPTARSTLQVASPIPPLISLRRRTTDPPPPHVPLNIRHCVLLV